MKLLLPVFACLSAILVPAVEAQATSCVPTEDHHAVSIHGGHERGLQSSLEVFGASDFYQILENKWVFALLRTDHGWAIRLFDQIDTNAATDLTALTPPLRGAPNPRDINGWHFRNADNTAPNTGDVNAPQHLRAFTITPGLAGTAGLKMSTGLEEPDPNDGLGWLEIVEFGLENPVPGEQVRMNYLKFNACLTWPRSEEEKAHFNGQRSLTFVAEEFETFAVCGLHLQDYALEAHIAPRILGGDIDGDGSLDDVVQIRRIKDGKAGLALCRAGTALELFGLGGQDAAGIKDGFVGQIEAWQWIGPNGHRPLHLKGIELPKTDGDILILERVEKEAIAVFWQDGALRSKQIYRYVEP